MSEKKSISTRLVITVDAGLSGLYAATTLVDKNVPILLFEAQARVGGRSRTLQTPSSTGYSGSPDQGTGYVASTKSAV